MQKTILIPTDFTVESLILVKQAVAQNQNNNLNIILLYSCFLTDSISELLFYSPEKIIKEKSNAKFHEALSVVTNRYYEQINAIEIEVFHGYSASSIESYVEKNKISQVFIPKNYVFKETGNYFDMTSIIRRSKLKYTELSWAENPDYTIQGNNLANLFID